MIWCRRAGFYKEDNEEMEGRGEVVSAEVSMARAWAVRVASGQVVQGLIVVVEAEEAGGGLVVGHGKCLTLAASKLCL
jgi:hypothetical protein